jgi:hypothetical protein
MIALVYRAGSREAAYVVMSSRHDIASNSILQTFSKRFMFFLDSGRQVVTVLIKVFTLAL